MWQLMLFSLLVPGTQAFAPAPLRWVGYPGRRFVVAPRAFLNNGIVPTRTLAPPQELMVWDDRGRMDSSKALHLTVNFDNTISWDGLCVEASAAGGDSVRLNRCTGGPLQQWDVLSQRHARGNQIQLKHSDQCLGKAHTGGSAVAPVLLRKCKEADTQSWMFEKTISVRTKSALASQHVGQDLSIDLFLRRVGLACMTLVMLGGLGLGAWMRHWQNKSPRLAFSQTRMPVRRDRDQGGVSLTVPFTMNQSSIHSSRNGDMGHKTPVVGRFRGVRLSKVASPRSPRARNNHKQLGRRTSGLIMTLNAVPENTSDAASVDRLDAINPKDFPILQTDAYPGKPLIYLDSGASSQKPVQVLEAMDEYYRETHANVHRGAHSLSIRATEAYEKARYSVKSFINAKRREEVVFTQGATDALNLVAMGWGQKLSPGDEIVLSVMEHHSNLVPWQLLAERTGVVLKFARLTDGETLDVDHLISLLTPRTKIVSIVHVSNTLGCINPIKQISQEAHKVEAVVVVDACQSVPHMPVDVQELECDFLAASSHKMCGPTGIGFLYGKYDVLSQMPPVQGGGEMIDQVELEGSTFLPPPARFEAGTPPVAEAVGLGAACEYLLSIGMRNIEDHEQALVNYLCTRLEEIPGIRIYGPKAKEGQRARAGLVAFNCEGAHASDVAFFLDQDGVAVRSGHHCTQPLHKILEAAGSCRASCYFYNSRHDVDTFIAKLKENLNMLREVDNLNSA